MRTCLFLSTRTKKEISINGNTHELHHVDLKDFTGGAVVGKLLLVKDVQESISAAWKSLTIKVVSNLILAVILSVILMIIIIIVLKPLSNFAQMAKELASGKGGDLSQNVPMQLPNASKIVKDTSGAFSNHSEATPCWYYMGEYGDKSCPILNNGLADCDSCKVFKTATHDEITEMSVYVNIFLRNIEKDFAQALYTLSNASESTVPISSGIVNVTGKSDENVILSSQVAAASEQMNATISEIAQNSTDSAHKAENTVELAEAGGNAISQALISPQKRLLC